MVALRQDGVLPTLTCGSHFYVPACKRRIDVAALAVVVGFHRYVADLVNLKPLVARKMLGNAMRVSVVGSIYTLALSVADL